MTDARNRNWHRAGPAAVAAAVSLVAIAAAGCDGGNGTTGVAGDGGTAGTKTTGGSAGTGGTGATAGTAGTGGTGATAGSAGSGGSGGTMMMACVDPTVASVGMGKALDATPDSAGENVYFTGSGPNGASVFSLPAGGGGTPKVLYAGDPLAAPLGITIANDDSHIYIADPGAEVSASDPKTKVGQIFSIVPAGSEPVGITGTEGYRPHGLDIGDDGGEETIFFTGVDPTDSKAGIFKVPIGGGAPAVVVKGSPFVELSGIAWGKAAIFVTDAISSDGRRGEVFIVQNGNPSIFLPEIGIGYPSGVALSLDEKTLFVSGINFDTGTNELLIVDVATKNVTKYTGSGVGKNRDAAGLHRARKSSFFSWADFGANQGAGSITSIKCP